MTEPFIPPKKPLRGAPSANLEGNQPKACYYCSLWSWLFFHSPPFFFFSPPSPSNPSQEKPLTSAQRLRAPRGCWWKAAEVISQIIKAGSRCERGCCRLPVCRLLPGLGWVGDCVQLGGILFPPVLNVSSFLCFFNELFLVAACLMVQEGIRLKKISSMHTPDLGRSGGLRMEGKT